MFTHKDIHQGPTQKVKMKATEETVLVDESLAHNLKINKGQGGPTVVMAPVQDFDVKNALTLKGKGGKVFPTVSQQSRDDVTIIEKDHEKVQVPFGTSQESKNDKTLNLRVKSKPQFGHIGGKRPFINESQHQPPRQDTSRLKKGVMDSFQAFNHNMDLSADVCLDRQELNEKELADHDLSRENGTVVGRGSFGSVYSCTSKRGRQMVVKELKRGVPVYSNEVLMPMDLPKGSGIVRMFGIKLRAERLWIVMEYAGQSLNWWLKNSSDDRFRTWSQIPENLFIMALQLFKILKILELHQIVHRDIKPENVCVQLKDGRCVFTLVDFGSAQSSHDEVVLVGHTTEYLTPNLNDVILKVKKGKFCTLDREIFFKEKCDVWGGAMMMLTVSNKGFHPIPMVNEYSRDETIQGQQRLQTMQTIIGLREGNFERLLSQIPNPLQTVLRKTLLLDREKALSATQAYNSLDTVSGLSKPKYPRISNDNQRSQNQNQQFPFVGQCQQTKPTLRPSKFPEGFQVVGKGEGIKIILDPGRSNGGNQSLQIHSKLKCNKADLMLDEEPKPIAFEKPQSPNQMDLTKLGVLSKQSKIVGMAAPATTSTTNCSVAVAAHKVEKGPTKVVGIGGLSNQSHIQQQRLMNGAVRQLNIAVNSTSHVNSSTIAATTGNGNGLFRRENDNSPLTMMNGAVRQLNKAVNSSTIAATATTGNGSGLFRRENCNIPLTLMKHSVDSSSGLVKTEKAVTASRTMMTVVQPMNEEDDALLGGGGVRGAIPEFAFLLDDDDDEGASKRVVKSARRRNSNNRK